MENWLIAISANLTLTYLLSRLVIYIDIRYRLQDKDDNIMISVCLFHNMTLYRMVVPVVKLTKESMIIWPESKVKVADEEENSQIHRENRFILNAFKIYLTHPKKFDEVICFLRHYTRIYQRFINKILSFLHCERLCWKTIFGSEDAAVTGMMVGALGLMEKFLITVMKCRIEFLQKPVVTVIPVFDRRQLEIDFQCIFSIRLGNVIKAMSCLFLPKRKEKGCS
ncbi:MAG: DUF2953 domain-containing protein [Veillonellales bacterium]